jgi:hypothetical protein
VDQIRPVAAGINQRERTKTTTQPTDVLGSVQHGS